MRLYKYTAQLDNLLEQAEADGLDEQLVADTKEALVGDIEQTIESYGCVYKQLESDASVLKAEEERLKARREVIENSAKRLKKAIEDAMRATEKHKIKTDLFSFNIQKNPPALKLAEDIDFDKIPAEFIVFPSPEIDKNAVKKAIDEGASFDWAHMEQADGLRIK